MFAQYAQSDEELLGAGTEGDERAWEEIVRRYAPLIQAITRRYRLPACDAQDVSQHVWLKLIDQGGRLRDPRALPGWISTTATRKCYELSRLSRRAVAVDPTSVGIFGRDDVEPLWTAAPAASDPGDKLVREEQRGVVRRALGQLTDSQQELLLLLVADPPIAYREIGERMGVPVGSIGPTRARLLKKLARTISPRDLGDDVPDGVLVAA